jgi:hypothetical protein
LSEYFLLTFVSVCMVLVPFVAQAGVKPVIYYSFDNIKGDVVEDLSGFNNDGTLEADPEIVTGQFGDGLAFESSRVSFPASDSFGGDLFQGSFTLVIWINPELAGNTWQQVFRALRAGDESNDTLFVNNDGRLSWRGRVATAWAGGMCETVPGVVGAGTWSHAAVVGDESNFRVYVNGKLSVESNFQVTDGANVTYLLGGASGGESYSGAVDDFAVFNVALEDAVIEAIMNGGVDAALAVESEGKLATKWAALKSAF